MSSALAEDLSLVLSSRVSSQASGDPMLSSGLRTCPQFKIKINPFKKMEEMEKSDFSENMLCAEGAEAVMVFTVSPSYRRDSGGPPALVFPGPSLPQRHCSVLVLESSFGFPISDMTGAAKLELGTVPSGDGPGPPEAGLVGRVTVFDSEPGEICDLWWGHMRLEFQNCPFSRST